MKKRILHQFFAAALALAFVGCGHDELTDGNSGTGDNNSKDAVYMNVTVQLPVGRTGTRGKTDEQGGSSDGTEVGLDRENRVHSVLLVLADKDNKFIGCAEKSENLATEKDGKITTVQSISKSVLSDYYGGDNGTLEGDKQQINVFVFCNPTNALKEIFGNVSAEDATWYDRACTISEQPDGKSDNAAIWGGPDHEGGFLMSSFEISTKRLPKNFSDWDNFTKVEKPFLLSGINSNIGGSSDNTVDNDGAIKVERSVARFDFKDGSRNEDNTYDVVKDQDDNIIMQIQLQKMALVNMSKNFYFLRRVSDNGLSDGPNFKLCGTETSSNYVVDTDATEKNDGSIIKGGNYENHFNFCLGNSADGWTIDANARNQWFTSKISEVLKGTDDNPDWVGTTPHGDYKIWRYVTENTIPGITSNQTNGISTGIVFKGKMIAPKGASGTLADALNGASGNPADDPILYAYGNNIHVTWKEVRAMAIQQGKGSPMYTAAFGNTKIDPVAEKNAADGAIAVKAVYSDDEESADYQWNAWHNAETGKDPKNLKIFKAAATTAGFTLYESSTDEGVNGYYCYYFYWNRHNDNGNNGVMGPMEFGVVRNNVYKLAVTNIKKLGHPRVSENDPDPVDPEDPDEVGDVYLSVSVEVLPWIVRVNNIEF